MSRFYTIMLPAVRFAFYSAMRLQVEGREHVPKSGPLIVVANHLNTIDPPLLGVIFPRQIVFMAKDELFAFPSALIMHSLGAFSARKFGKSGMGLRRAIKVLRDGNVLGIFPEGKRSADHSMTKGENGVAYIALRSGAPLIAVGICGSEAFTQKTALLRRPLVNVTIGEPFSFAKTQKKLSDEELVQVTESIMQQIARVLPPDYRGVYDENVIGNDNENQSGR